MEENTCVSFNKINIKKKGQWNFKDMSNPKSKMIFQQKSSNGRQQPMLMDCQT